MASLPNCVLKSHLAMTSPERDLTYVRLGFGQGRRLKSLITPNTPSIR